MKNNICLIYNFAQHYRSNIFQLLDRELPVDFVFGDKYLDVKKMDYSLLTGFKKEVKNKTFISSPYYYQTGVLSLLKEDYNVYLMLGEVISVSTWLVLIVSKFYKKKKVYLWTHGWYGREGYVKKNLKKVFFNLADGVFLYGNYAKNLMLKEGFDKEKLHVIYNSLAYDQQLPLRKKLKPTGILKKHFNNDFKTLIFIGRLTKVKRLDLLLEAVSNLKVNNKDYNLILIGEGEVKEELNKYVVENNMEESVWFYGQNYNETELANLIYNADLCISPGNVGLTAIHSMMFGTPVVTHDNFSLQMPEFEAVVENETGMFFKYNDLTSLINTIDEWFNKKIDRETIRERCYKTIDEKFNPHVQLEIFKKHLM